jgi:Ca-activated chloride channel family protein
MSGNKFEQAKGALRFVLNNLREGDLFNLVAYDSQVESFRPELERWNADSRQAALGFVEGLYTGGSTNIDGALTTALGMLKDSDMPSYIIFLTDGLPTIGEVHEAKIVENSRQGNRVRARLFAFGVGYDVNSRLLDRLVRANYGQSEYVRPNEDIEASVSRLYQRIGTPVLTDVAITFDMDGTRPEEGPLVNRMYPRDQYDLFAGDQLVLVGRYRRPGGAKVSITGSAGGQLQRFDSPAEFVAESRDQTNLFVEKLWAVRRVGEIIDELDLKGNNDELVKELVELATRHGILTPYTSFLADETNNWRDRAGNVGSAREQLGRLAETQGRFAIEQRLAKGAYQRADSSRLATAQSYPASASAAPSDSNEKVEINTVKYVGAKTFYLRGGRWVDSVVTAEQEKAPAMIQRFSKEYFDLVSKHGKLITAYLALDEPLIVELDGQAYVVE